MYIFQFLHLTDLKSARLVCHSWYEAAQDQKLIGKEIVDFHYYDTVFGRQLVPDLVNSNREFLHFLFKVSSGRLNE